MTVSMNMHVGPDEKISVTTHIFATGEGHASVQSPEDEFALIRLRIGTTEVDLFTHKLSDLETMSFHLSALIQELRDEHQWSN